MKVLYALPLLTFIGVGLEEPAPITEFAEYVADVYELLTGAQTAVKDVSDEIDPESIAEDPKTMDTILAVGTEQDPTLFLVPGTKVFKSDIYTIKQHIFFDPRYLSDELPPELKELHSFLFKLVDNQTVH